MIHLAVVGSGPAGYYTAEAAQKRWGDGVRVDIIDRLPVPYGLIRSGVAPDHQSIKAVAKRYASVATSDNVRFVGNVQLGRDLGVNEALYMYHAVVLATGAPADRPLGIAGADLPGVIGSAAFVGWYNGHPDFAQLAPPLVGEHAVVIGNGNVALDVARILAKTPGEFVGSDIVAHAFEALGNAKLKTITIVGRRGPHQIAMTPKELGELAHLERASVSVDPAALPPPSADAALDPGQRKAVAHLRDFARLREVRPVEIRFLFNAQPLAIEGDGRVERLVVERTRLLADGTAEGTGVRETVPADLIVPAIGYRTPPIDGVPYDDRAGRFANEGGRVAPGLYAVGWARRGPSGTIGTNRPDGESAIEAIAADLGDDPPPREGRPALDALLAARGVEIVTFRDWLRIEREEVGRARAGSPREKFVALSDMIEAKRR